MSNIKITGKHHKHLNNPFTPTPKSLPLIQGTLFHNLHSLSSHHVFSIGTHFDIHWTDADGGSLSISHRSWPSKSIWSMIPGQAFVSAAMVETEVDESRGSFAVKDKKVLLVCNHQWIEDIRVIDDYNGCLEVKNDEFLCGYLGFDLNHALEGLKGPFLLVKGWIYSMKRKRRKFDKEKVNEKRLLLDGKTPYAFAKYWVLFYEKSANQIGFKVKVGKPSIEFRYPKSSARDWRSTWVRKSRLGLGSFVSRRKGFVSVSSLDDSGTTFESTESGDFNRVCLTYSSKRNEKIFGFGEQFSHMDFKGKRVPIFVQEQGIGRGDQPITLAANLISYRAGGDWSTTYAPSPFYMTSLMRSLYLEGYQYSVFDFTMHHTVQIQVHGSSVEGAILHGKSPVELIEVFTETIGRPPQLPDWIISGAVVGMQGGTDAVRHVWNTLQSYDVPISSFWLQDWVGQRETVIGSQLWWNWEVDTSRYKGWRQLIKDLGTHHIQVMTYCNPCLAPTDGKPNTRRNLYKEAKKLDILIKGKDGKPYMVPNTSFDVGMLDLTHPNTATWFKKILFEMVEDGVRGWMADFGEGLPLDAILHSGEDPISAHNRYPELWAQINREFVEEWKQQAHPINKNKDEENELVFFMRAGFRETPKWAMLFWEGDQMVSWQKNDGIKSSVVGLLSSGLSGYALNHSDIGGYCAVNLPLIKYHRTQELLLRWMELNAFSTIFRTHEGNRPACNTQFYSNQRTLSHFARFAKVYRAWKFYRVQLVKEASEKGLPVCRHMFIHYPKDEYVHKLTYQQFLVGSEILVAPVLDKARHSVKVYFPIGESSGWKHIWTGKVYIKQGSEVRVEAPLGYPAVFVKADSFVAQTFLQNLRQLKLL